MTNLECKKQIPFIDYSFISYILFLEWTSYLHDINGHCDFLNDMYPKAQNEVKEIVLPSVWFFSVFVLESFPTEVSGSFDT